MSTLAPEPTARRINDESARDFPTNGGKIGGTQNSP
jgi:hypothetical protein